MYSKIRQCHMSIWFKGISYTDKDARQSSLINDELVLGLSKYSNKSHHDGPETNDIQDVIITDIRGIGSDFRFPVSTTSLIIHNLRSPFRYLPINFIPPGLKHLSLACLAFDHNDPFLVDTIESFELVTPKVTGQIVLPSGLKSFVHRVTKGNSGYIPFRFVPFSSLVSLTTLEMRVKDIETGVLPASLTSLNLSFQDHLPKDFLKPLASLVNLELNAVMSYDTAANTGSSCLLDFRPLHSLKTLHFYYEFEDEGIPHGRPTLQYEPYTVDFIPATLHSLTIQYSSLACAAPLPSSLTYLDIGQCHGQLPVGLVPHGVTHLRIGSLGLGLQKGSIPTSVTKLSLGYYNGPTTSSFLPDSIKQLSWNRKYRDGRVPLPKQLEKLEWAGKRFEPLYGSQLNGCPVTLTSLTIPMSIDYIPRGRNYIFSLSDHFPNYQDGDDNHHLLLPPSIKHLTCRIEMGPGICCFRLDQVINQTNVERLTINFMNYNKHASFDIKRLDENNSQILMVDRRSIFGGFITQQRRSNQQPQQQQRQQQQPSEEAEEIQNNCNGYRPLYLCCGNSTNPFWSHQLPAT
ncbi:hypothetical protein DFA_03106 [Cavenderia fasciculata]|uniref:Uncharacterized protein n=1 Tax=Cavenderia fasciculata TaxID=261658 RepID=F4PGM7_CACFS|nr:uncharacterized protein DFA_03106 [Cavenderia fasciculata]EGG24861.1 hypothetical protein DFA_03106 [Cavenderia fasciculata]|eukprot:XP_004362712.1 hypothetical protein DFA_03106 [Cavenderia fasciculata]